MQLRAGYKNTETGVLPEDWDLKTFKDISFMKGRIGWQGLNQSEFTMNSDEPFLITGMNFKDGEIRWEEVYHISNERYEIAKDIQLKQDDVLITKDGTIGKLLFIDNIPYPYKASLNSHLLVFRPINKSYYPKFLYYQLSSKIFKDYVEIIKYGTTFFGISQEGISKYKVFLPSFEEQTLIATALSDADALISSLEKLIEKKRAIKQGAMQQLLKPKEGWEVKKLGEIGKCIRGVSYNGERDLHPHDIDITVRLLRSNNVQQETIELNDLQFVDKNRVKEIQYLRENDVLICMANGSKKLVGKAATFRVSDHYNYTFGAFMGCYRIFSIEADPIFIFYNFLSNNYRSFIDILLSGSSINNLKPSDIESIKIPFPPLLIQNQIANILTEMEKEISSLKNNLEKQKMIKQGMMQNLLTGNIRLV